MTTIMTLQQAPMNPDFEIIGEKKPDKTVRGLAFTRKNNKINFQRKRERCSERFRSKTIFS